MKHIYLTIIALMSCLTASAWWGSETGVQPKPAGTNDYGTEYVIGPDGTIWFYYYHPSSTKIEDVDVATYQICLQAIDKNGNLKFGSTGKVVSNYDNWSWTQVNQSLYANSDSTVTLVVSDCRNSEDMNKSYTAYRFRPDGTSVWDEDGVNLDEAMVVDFTADMTFCELSDGSTAFAWMRSYGDGEAIEIQKVSKDGKCMYNLADTRLCKTNGYYEYPYMVPSEDGSFILVYAYSSSMYLRAMRYNNDGTKAWDDAVKIYGGGWGSVPALQSRMKVYPGPDYGVIVTWNDDRNNDGWYAPYIAYIKKDGTSAFTNENGKPDIKLSYEEYSCNPPAITLSPDNKYIYAALGQFAQGNQSYQQMSVQKLNMDGELLWGDNAVQVMPIDYQQLSYASVQNGKEGEIMFFYQTFYDYHNVENVYSILDAETGMPVSDETDNVVFSTTEAYRASLESTYNKTDDTILLFWDEDPVSCSSDSETGYEVLLKMNLDGSIYQTPAEGIENVAQQTKTADSPCYSIEGRIMSSLKKGDIFIHNGKKIIK